jgi:hypothetical protein
VVSQLLLALFLACQGGNECDAPLWSVCMQDGHTVTHPTTVRTKRIPSMSLSALSVIAVLSYGLVYRDRLDIALPFLCCLLRQQHVIFTLLLALLIASAICLAVTFFRSVWGYCDTAPIWKGPGKPLLFPCRTSHSRVFPKKHSFNYSYLVVGIPVGWEGCIAGLVSVGTTSDWKDHIFPTDRPQTGWYHVDPSDYLERGNGHLGLRGKLDRCLREQVRMRQYASPSHFVLMGDRVLIQAFIPMRTL